MAETREIETPYGPARATLHRPAEGVPGLLALGHGAGGGIKAPDLLVATEAGLEAGLTVALIEQPYRVAGRRSPAPARQLDAAWQAVIGVLRRDLPDGPLIAGGRSSGARVACRTAEATGAAGVLCLAFPLLAPARRGSGERPTRLPELDGVPAGVQVLVVQGLTDPFGMPPQGRSRIVTAVRGDHGLKGDLGAVGEAIAAWLPAVIALSGG